MVALLHDALVRQHQDPVRISDARQPVGDRERGAPFRKLTQRLCNRILALIVQCRGRLVEDQYRRIFQKYPGDADALFLPAGELHAALTDIRVIFVLQILYELVRPGALCRFHDLLARRAGLSVSDIFIHRTREQIDLLLDDTDALAEAL